MTITAVSWAVAAALAIVAVSFIGPLVLAVYLIWKEGKHGPKTD